MQPSSNAVAELLKNAHDDPETSGDFEAAFEKHGEVVFRRCYSLLNDYDEAADAAQLIWTKVYFAIDGFRGDAAFTTWLYRIVYNQCISMIRKRHPSVPFDESVAVDPAMIDSGLAQRIQRKLDTAEILQHISMEERALLIMKYVDNQTYVDLAEHFSVSESAIKMRVARVKQKIQEVYAAQEQ